VLSVAGAAELAPGDRDCCWWRPRLFGGRCCRALGASFGGV